MTGEQIAEFLGVPPGALIAPAVTEALAGLPAPDTFEAALDAAYAAARAAGQLGRGLARPDAMLERRRR